MKIGIDARTLMDAQYSGVSEYTLNLIQNILKLDSENDYRLFYNSAHDISGYMPKFEQPNCKVIKFNYPNKILNYIGFKLLRLPKIDKLLGVDVFFMPHINFMAVSGKTKTVLTVHDLSFLRYGEFFSWRKNFWHRMLNVKKMVRQADEIIVISESTKNDIVELYGIDQAKIEVVYSGIGEEFRLIDKADQRLKEIKEKYGLPEKFIFFLGTIEPRKNLEGLILAYDQLRAKNPGLDHGLAIAGGKGWKSDNIFKAWEKSPYKNDIKFLGYIDRKDKPYLYNLASLFVYPSFYEGFGFPPLEAFASGVPVVASFSSSLPEIIGDAGLMADPYDASSLSLAMEEVLGNNELKEDLVRKGFERVKKFSWVKTAENYLKILAE